MRQRFLALALLTLASSLHAAPVWVIGGNAATPAGDGCTATTWTGDTVLQNTTDAPVVIGLDRTSDSNAVFIIRPQFILPAHSTTSMRRHSIGAPTTPIWIDQLDVPDGVIVEGRIEIGASICNISPPIFGPVNGKLSAPTFRALAPAGTVQRHLGTDLGLVDARVNVGVYNGGNDPATARIEVRRACDDALLQSSTISLKANGFQQVSLNVGAPQPSCESNTQVSNWVTYTTVTVDQPSLSFTSTISNNVTHPIGPIFAPYGISL
jgi:hypothetical protein